MKITPTTRIVCLDLDGNELHVFMGYDMPTTQEVFSVNPEIYALMLYSRNGEFRRVNRAWGV